MRLLFSRSASNSSEIWKWMLVKVKLKIMLKRKWVISPEMVVFESGKFQNKTNSWHFFF